MQTLWNRAMMIARTRGAYGLTFPVEGTSFPPPTPGTMHHDLCFACTATEEEYQALLAAIREDMAAWKARVGSGAIRKRSTVSGIDLSALEIDL